MCSWFSKLDKNQKINQNYLESKVESIESKIDNLGSIITVGINKEAKNPNKQFGNSIRNYILHKQ